MEKNKPYFIDLSGKSKKEINLFLEVLLKGPKGVVIKKKLVSVR